MALDVASPLGTFRLSKANGRKLRPIRVSNLYPVPRLSSPTLDSYSLDIEESLPHKRTFFDLKSDATDDSDISELSEGEEYDVPKSSIDSYFSMPARSIPTKQKNTNTHTPLKSLSNSSLFLTNPPILSPLQSSFSLGLPSFDSPKSPEFPRHCKVRRTHSMFENPKEVLKEESPEPTLASQTSILTQEDCPIKSYAVQQDSFRRIEPDTLCEILEGKHAGLYDRHVIVDCRFEYEFEGGHIEGAVNINNKDLLHEKLISNVSGNHKTLVVFHCEYSAHRGPRMAMQLRNIDREVNMNRYPLLHYPDIVILSGGYAKFFKNHSTHCFPQQYVAMNDNSAGEKKMDKFRRDMRFSRTQSLSSFSKLSPVIATRSQSMFTLNTSFKFPTNDSCIETKPFNNDSTPTIQRKKFTKLSP